MKVVALAKDGYDYSSEVDDFVAEAERRAGAPVIEKVDPDSYEGESLARSLDVLEFPAVIAIDSNGTPAQQWLGIPLPSYDEVVYYINS